MVVKPGAYDSTGSTVARDAGVAVESDSVDAAIRAFTLSLREEQAAIPSLAAFG